MSTNKTNSQMHFQIKHVNQLQLVLPSQLLFLFISKHKFEPLPGAAGLGVSGVEEAGKSGTGIFSFGNRPLSSALESSNFGNPSLNLSPELKRGIDFFNLHIFTCNNNSYSVTIWEER